jgi:hypothetical protein
VINQQQEIKGSPDSSSKTRRRSNRLNSRRSNKGRQRRPNARLRKRKRLLRRLTQVGAVEIMSPALTRRTPEERSTLGPARSRTSRK